MDEEQTNASLPTSSNGFRCHDISSSLPYSNGSHISSIIENPTFYNVSARTPEGLNPNNMQHGAESSLSDMFNSGGLSSGMVDMFAHRDIPIPPYIQNSNGGSSFGFPLDFDDQYIPQVEQMLRNNDIHKAITCEEDML
ncbi:hypothetical protein P8452_63759 [Trifolium repens]|nr:hypothetical protein P8452_63759 [Trifolium repens]